MNAKKKLILGAVAIDRVLVFCPKDHPIYKYVASFCESHYWDVISSFDEIVEAEYLFLISCSQKLDKALRDKVTRAIVIHESDLPKGRGWSPLAWQILEGKSVIPVKAIECADPIDSGKVYYTDYLLLNGTELSHEITRQLARVKERMIQEITKECPEPHDQRGEPSYYPRRTPEDSRLDPDKSIKDQFNLMRIAEDRFPCFFELNGRRFKVKLEAM